VSLYMGVSYRYITKTNIDFWSDMRGKVMLIFNNRFENNDREELSATQYLGSDELFLGALQAGIATYVVGPHFSI